MRIEYTLCEFVSLITCVPAPSLCGSFAWNVTTSPIYQRRYDTKETKLKALWSRCVDRGLLLFSLHRLGSCEAWNASQWRPTHLPPFRIASASSQPWSTLTPAIIPSTTCRRGVPVCPLILLSILLFSSWVCDLRILCNSIGRLTALRRLILAANHISELPPSICACTALVVRTPCTAQCPW